jgi:hypothetical protein
MRSSAGLKICNSEEIREIGAILDEPAAWHLSSSFIHKTLGKITKYPGRKKRGLVHTAVLNKWKDTTEVCTLPSGLRGLVQEKSMFAGVS